VVPVEDIVAVFRRSQPPGRRQGDPEGEGPAASDKD
jgi:hypothetical protein